MTRLRQQTVARRPAQIEPDSDTYGSARFGVAASVNPP